jgi:hypothetical protein
MLFSFSAYGRQSPARPAGEDSGGIVVVLEQVQSGKVVTARTDAKGNFSFSDVEPGAYRLRFGCGESGAQAGKLECLAEMRIEISDKSKGSVTGTIQKSPNN